MPASPPRSRSRWSRSTEGQARKTLLTAVALALALPVAPADAAPPLTPIGEIARGTDVRLAGTVARLTDEDAFTLRDATGSVQVYVGPNRVPAAQGETVTVIGHVDDDRPLAVYATEIIRADVTRATLPHRY